MSANRSMLDGIRIADMSGQIFGPYCTQMLADLGADVVKVEPPAGDMLRNLGRPKKTPGMGKIHMTINRGKRSVNWDTKTEQGRAKLRALIGASDVFIHNIRGEAMRRLGFDYETVRSFAPDIIYVHCTGFDSAGPSAGHPAYDDIIQGASGIAALASEVEGLAEPQYLPLALADKVAGLYAAQAVLAALIHKLRFGGGQFVEVPMFEAVTAFHLLENFAGAIFPDEPGPPRYRHTSVDRQPSPTANGYICLAPYNDDRWIRLFDVLGRPDILEDERLNTPALRQRNRALLYRLIAEITPLKTSREWLDLFGAADVPAAPMNTLADLLEDPQLAAVGFFRERIHPTEGRYYEMRPPVKFAARPDPAPGFPPHIGEHNRELDEELGFAPKRED
ncbi:MAG: CoA transferase [Sphingomonadales bacterium]|nr:CoA transferase [Sphingomonadales bacterium]